MFVIYKEQMGHSSLLNYRLLKNMTNLEAMIRILNVKGIWNLDDLNTQQFALFQSVAPSEECRAHTCACFYLSVLVVSTNL